MGVSEQRSSRMLAESMNTGVASWVCVVGHHEEMAVCCWTSTQDEGEQSRSTACCSEKNTILVRVLTMSKAQNDEGEEVKVKTTEVGSFIMYRASLYVHRRNAVRAKYDTDCAKARVRSVIANCFAGCLRCVLPALSANFASSIPSGKSSSVSTCQHCHG